MLLDRRAMTTARRSGGTKAAVSQKLEAYHHKRDFAATPEPKGGGKRGKAGFGYLIQKHDATRLHYDFRLELDGVLLSWAVPKGPSVAPAERRLAVRTEDHPLEYGTFEGVIPAGEYGGGTVMLWDRGTWEPVEDPHEGLRKGHLVFTLHGERLKGRWHLVRTRGKPREKSESWLLFKGKDAESRRSTEPVKTQLTSVVSGRTMDEIAAEKDRTWSSKGAGETTSKPKKARRSAKRAAGTAETKALENLASLVAQIPTTVSFTNLDKVLWADVGITKAALAAYYAIVEPYMMPHLANRPVTLVRCPEGAPGVVAAVRQTPSKRDRGERTAARFCFYQKHMKKGFPASLLRVPIREDDGTNADYLAIADRDGLMGAVQLGSLEIHTWGCHIDDVERPDYAVIDLDPDPGLGWDAVVEAAFEVRVLLEDVGLRSWVKTTGGKGVHVCFPVTRRTSWDDFKAFTHSIAATMVANQPDRYTTNMAKARRKGKIFVDYLRNGRGATAVAPYSTRARPGATVSAPLTWEELAGGARPEDFDIRTMIPRLDALAADPWEGFFSTKQSITQAMWKKLAA